MTHFNLNKPATPSLAERIGFLIYRLGHPFRNRNHHPTTTLEAVDTMATAYGEKPPGLIYHLRNRLINLFEKLVDATLKAVEPFFPSVAEYPLKTASRRRIHVVDNLINILNKLLRPILDLTESIYLSLFHPYRLKQREILTRIIEIARGKGFIIVVIITGFMLSLSAGEQQLSAGYVILLYIGLPICIALMARKPTYGLTAYLFLAVGGIQNAFWNFPRMIFGTRLFLTTPILLASMLSWVVNIVKRREKIRAIYDSNNHLVIGYWCFLTLSFIFASPNYSLPAQQWASITTANYLAYVNWLVIFFAVIYIIGDDKKKFFSMLYAIVGIYGFFAYRIIRMASFQGFASIHPLSTGLTGRLIDNNELAACLNMALPIVYALFLCGKTRIKKAIFLITFIITIVAIVYTGSRGALLGLIVLSIPLFFKLMLSTARNKVWPVIFVVVLAVSGYHVPIIHKKIESRMESVKNWQGDRSATNRILSVIVAWEMMKDSPIVGQGANSYYKFMEFCPDEAVIRVGLSSDDTLELKGAREEFAIHNAYASLGAESGIPSLMLFIWLILHSIRKLRRLRKQCPFNKENEWIHYLSHALELSILAYITTSMFLNNSHDAFIYIICAMTSSLCYIACKPTKKQNIAVSLTGLILFGLWLYYTVGMRA